MTKIEITGQTGTGKSFMARVIKKALREEGFTVSRIEHEHAENVVMMTVS